MGSEDGEGPVHVPKEPGPRHRGLAPPEGPDPAFMIVPEDEPSLPGRAENELTTLDEELLQSLVESADYAARTRLSTPEGRDFVLGTPEAVRSDFLAIWESLATELRLDYSAEAALQDVRDLVVYDIPDGTRSTLTVPPMMDVDLDAGMYCLALVHTLNALGARHAVVMTHTVYNRARGPEETRRFLNVIAKAVEPAAQYARRHRIGMEVVGHGRGYELEELLERILPKDAGAAFRAHFLVDYAEEMFLTPEGREALAALPEVDVCVRHTKLQVSGGWIPTRMLHSSYVYCQNGTLFSNWDRDEYAALVAVALLSKKLMSGEVLSKSYVEIDDVKRRYQLRELNLFQRAVRLRPDPKKLFVVGSPVGLYQIYY